MKIKQIIILIVLILLPNGAIIFAQQDRLAEAKERIAKINEIINKKGYQWKAGLTSMSLLSKEEFKRRCGIIADTTFEPLKQKEYGEKLYQEWKKSQGKGLGKITTSIDWQGWMSNEIENQGSCGNCWAHASTGVAEGLLHYFYGQNIDIDLDEVEITDNATCADGCDGCEYGHEDCGLSYIKDYEVSSEDHGQFPNRLNAYYSIASYSTQSESISAIITALNSSPVFASMSVYDDFRDLTSDPNYIYEYTYGNYVGDHAIVIVDYGNDNGTDYWVCKNSWGEDWGNEGYFKIKFGECGIDNYGDFVTSTVNLNSFASFVPQFFNTINNAIQVAKSGEVVYVSSGTYTENLNMKAGVAVKGSGQSSTTINGKVNFNNGGADLRDLTVKGKIDIYYSGGVDIDNVKQDYRGSVGVDHYYSSSEIDGFESTSWNYHGIYVHTYSDSYIEDSNVRNKGKGLFVISFSDATAAYTNFCTNASDIIAGFPSSVYAHNCTFSSPTPGGSVYGNVSWNSWTYCGMGKSCASTSEPYPDENPMVVQEDKQKDPAGKDYFDAKTLWKEVKKALKQDKKSGKGYDPDKYASEIREAAEKFKDVVSKYPLSLYAGLSLGFISRAHRLLGEHGVLFDYVENLTADKKYQNLKPQALSVLIGSFINQGQYEEAIAQSDQIIASFPQDSLVCELLYGKGLIYKHYLNDKAKAAEMFQAVIELFPDHPTALSAQGQLEDMGHEPLAKNMATTKELSELSAQSYPNPFNPTTSIHFTLPEQGRVVLKIYDILGREVKTLVDEEKPSGRHTVLWDGRDTFGRTVASGTYLYQLRFRDKVLTEKITLMR